MYMSRHSSHRDNWLPNHVDYHSPGYTHLFDCQDQYGIWAPGTKDKCWVNDAFNLYAMEVEEQRERAEAIEKFISCLAASDDPNDTQNQWAAAEYANICEFSPAEQLYIEKEVAERWNE